VSNRIGEAVLESNQKLYRATLAAPVD
jgi:hypothetical protein